MKVLQPKIKGLQEQFQNDRPRMQQEMMALYKKEQVNPLAGCLPILIQIPIFFALYKVLFVSLEMRHAPSTGLFRTYRPRIRPISSRCLAFCRGHRPPSYTWAFCRLSWA